MSTGQPVADRFGWKPAGTPTFYLLNPQGVTRYQWAGAPGEKVMDAALEKVIEQAENAGKAHRRSRQARANAEDRVAPCATRGRRSDLPYLPTWRTTLRYRVSAEPGPSALEGPTGDLPSTRRFHEPQAR